MHSLNGNIHTKNLKFCHLNIQGGLPHQHKRAEIENILEVNSPHIMGLSETNQGEKDVISFENSMYNFHPGWTYSKEKTRVGILVRKGLKVRIRKDIMSELQLPAVWAEVKDKGKIITVINTYREHRQVGLSGDNADTKSGAAQLERLGDFIHYWERSLSESDETWLLGDTNLDPAVKGSKDAGSYYKRKMYELVEERILDKGVVQLINGPTWVNANRFDSILQHRERQELRLGPQHGVGGEERRGSDDEEPVQNKKRYVQI